MSFPNRNPASPAAPSAPARSKYAGIQAGGSRDPMLDVGRYRVRITACTEGVNPGTRRESYKVQLQVLEAAEGSATSKGAVCTAVHLFTAPGLAELKRMAVSAAGYGPTIEEREADPGAARTAAIEGERSYDALDESHGYQGAILEASAGHPSGAPSLVGQSVDVIVTKGKNVVNPQSGAPTGDFYRHYVWGAVRE